MSPNPTTSQLLAMSSAELDDLFASSPAGPIPNGNAQGTAIFAPDTIFTPELAQLVNIFAWQGKVFDAKDKLLVNKITVLGIRAIVAEIRVGPSWVDGKDCIVLDYSKTSLVAHWVRDEIRRIGEELWLGVVFWDNTRLIHFTLQFPTEQ